MSESSSLNAIVHSEMLDEQIPTSSKHLSSFQDEMKDLWKCQWYWGGITSKRAIRLLSDRPIGTFLVRDSHSENCVFTLSYKMQQKIYHTRIERHSGKYTLGSKNALIQSPSIIGIIKQTMDNSTALTNNQRYNILMQPTTVDPTTHFVQLKYPLGRDQFLHSLKYWCRWAIRRRILDVSLIGELNLPQSLKNYLADPCFTDAAH